jgi:hypothetical protein
MNNQKLCLTCIYPLCFIFLKIEKRDPSLMQDYGRDPQYADASIDAMREQKIAVNEFDYY